MIFRGALAAVLLVGPPASAEPAPTAIPLTVTACDEIGEFPPYIYLQRENGRPVGQPTGYSVDFLEAALAPSGRQAAVTLLPWKRCLESVAAGEIDLVLSASRTNQRLQDFILLDPAYELHHIYVFDRRHPPPKAENTAELAQSTLCGQLGYNYEAGGIVGTASIEEARTFEGAIDMLLAGRCQLLVAYREVVEGHSRLDGRDLLPPDRFGIETMNDARPEPMSMMIGRKLPYGAALAELLNQGTAALKKSGEADRLLRRYVPAD